MNLLVVLCLLTGCAPIIQEKRLLQQTDHKDLQKLAAPPSDPTLYIKRKQIKSVVKEKIDPIFFKKVSVILQDRAPIRQVLTEIARQVGVAILIDHDIKTNIHYVASQKPFIQMMEELTEALGLRFTISGKFIKIEKDTPHPKTYNVHFLKFERESVNSISSATDIFHDTDSKNTVKNNSDSEIKVKSTINFWDELEAGLKFYLGAVPFTIHRQAGLVSVMATEKQHRYVKDYLTRLQKNANTQVLIEAKIIEVKLKQEFKTGIDWTYMYGNPAQPTTLQAGINKDFKILDFKHTNFNMMIQALEHFGSLRTVSSPRIVLLNNQTSIIKVAENSVFFKVDHQMHYLGLMQNPAPGQTPERYKVLSSAEIKSKPIGFIMPIQVCVQPDTGKILLFVRPTVSRKSREIKDPAVDFNAKAAHLGGAGQQPLPESHIPVVEVREMDSVLQLESGDVTMLGGLMEVKSQSDVSHLPVPGGLNKLSNALGYENTGEEVYELVILLRAIKIDNGEESETEADYRLQKEYVKDPRPFVRS